MSKEAVGQNGELLGSPGYWNNLNRDTILRQLMRSAAPTDYRAALRTMGERAGNAIDAIYRDLEEHQSTLRYLSASDRKALAKQTEGLYDICKMSGITAMRSSDCIHALNLSNMSPWSRSSRDDRAVEQAVDYIRHNRHYSISQTLDLLKEATRWSISSAAGRDVKKQAYLKTILQEKDESFLKDVLAELENREKGCSCRGRCGHSIGSSDYLDWVETSFVAKSLPLSGSARWGSPNYARLFQDALQAVADRLERDLDAAARNKDYITDTTKAQLKAVTAELSDCGVSTHRLNDKIDKLAWFVGGGKDKIKELQHLLNELLGSHIEEDGVYGEETKNAEKALADRITEANKYLKNSKNLKNLDRMCVLCLAIPSRTTLIAGAILAARKPIQLAIWQQLAVPALMLSGFELTAKFLAHATTKNPRDLNFPSSSSLAEKIRDSKAVQNGITAELSKIRESEAITGKGSFTANYYETGEKDFSLSLGRANVYYTYWKKDQSIILYCVLHDIYNFDALRIAQVADKVNVVWSVSIPNLANDVGLFSQADGVLTPYEYTIPFQQTAPLD